MKPSNLLILEAQRSGPNLDYNLLPAKEVEAADIELSDGRRIQLTPIADKLPDVQIHACAYVDSTDLVPNEWDEWFSGEFDCDVSFGDANRTLIDVETFLNGTSSIDWDSHDVSEEEVEAWEKKIRALGNIYIDLEN